MANNFSTLDRFSVVGQELMPDLTVGLAPISIWADYSSEVASQYDSITAYRYTSGTSPTTQNISGGGSISYAAAAQFSDVNLSPIPILLANYDADGFEIPELLFNKSPIKNLVQQFASIKVYNIAKKVQTKINTLIDGQYGYYTVAPTTFTLFMNSVSQCFDLGMIPGHTVAVLKGSVYAALVASLPSLPGIDATKALQDGTIENLAGVKVMRTNTLPAAAPNGYFATRDALAVAIRPLNKLDPALSYGQSDIFTAADDSGLSMRGRKFQAPEAGKISVVFDLVYGCAQANLNALVRII